jgi:hypothetical protein
MVLSAKYHLITSTENHAKHCFDNEWTLAPSKIPLHKFYLSPLQRTLIHLFASTLIGMRGNNFISLFVLEHILRADFLSKNFQTFLEMKIDINWVSLTTCQAH